MSEELVTFETAKLAKEKGFDWKNIKILEVKSKSAFLDNTTQSLLQKWLREVHDIHVGVNVRVHEKHTNNIVMYAYEISTSKNYYDGIGDNLSNWIKCLTPTKEYNALYHTYKTFEEAFELGLQEALKSIKL